MFNSISNKKVYEQVIEQIQKNIMDGTFKKGDKLPSERELSEKMAVSRTSIREALRVLETMGVVESRQGEGNFICSNIEKSSLQPLSMMFKLNNGSWSDIFELRNILEIECARLCSLRATDLDCRELESIVHDMEKETFGENRQRLEESSGNSTSGDFRQKLDGDSDGETFGENRQRLGRQHFFARFDCSQQAMHDMLCRAQ